MRPVVALAILVLAVASCSGGPGDNDPFFFASFYAGIAVGLVAAAAIVAYGFSRPGSFLRRVGYVVVAFALWAILIVAGFWWVIISHPMV